MYEYIIKEYIKRLSLNDIKNFADSEGIPLNDIETKIIYDFIKDNYNNAIKNPQLINIESLKNKFDPLKYKQIYEVYTKYKDKFLKE